VICSPDIAVTRMISRLGSSAGSGYAVAFHHDILNGTAGKRAALPVARRITDSESS